MLTESPTVAGSATESPPFDTGNGESSARRFTTAPNAAALAITREAFDRITDVAGWARLTGEAIAQSGMFGVGTPQAGYMIATHCYLTRTSPLDWARTYHIIEGKQTMRADTMLARFREAGGRVKWTKMGDEDGADRVEAKWTFEGNSYSIAYTLADAQRAGLAGRSVWQKNPAEMMRARLVAKAVRMIAPEVISGVYCPEELGEAGTRDDAGLVPVANEEKTPKIHVPAVTHVPVAPVAPVAPVVAAPVVEPTPAPVAPVTSQVVAAPVAPAVQSPPVVQAPADPQRTPITRDQAMRIAAAKKALEINDEKWASILAKRNVKSAKELTAEQAHELIEKLADLQRKRVAEAPNPQAEAARQSAGELTAWAEGALTPKPTPTATASTKPA